MITSFIMRDIGGILRPMTDAAGQLRPFEAEYEVAPGWSSVAPAATPPGTAWSAWRPAANRESLVATHLSFPSVRHVAVAGDVFRWVPGPWEY
jgi:hypothetical protein